MVYAFGALDDRKEPTEITFFKNMEIENIYCSYQCCFASSSNIL
jgi:hypothetical protein